MKSKGKKKFTVVGYYESTGEIGNYHVEAKDECEAVKNVPGIIDGSDFWVVSIFKGHLVDQNESNKVSAICDWPGRK